jgi:prepilin-type N-terminal cleavage/methylation domain-containing protein
MRRAEKGVTLLELLLAVTLLSLLSVAMFTAMRLGLSAFTKTDDKLMLNRRAAGAQRILQSELEGIMPVKVFCGPNQLNPVTQSGGMMFFAGRPDAVHLVSTFSLQDGWRGRPQILEMFVIPGEDRGVRLVVNEIPYTGFFSAGQLCQTRPDGLPQFPPDQAGPASFVLADKLAYCRFWYLVPPPDPNQRPAWTLQWSQPGLPLAIRVEMAPLDPDPSQVQPITITAPVHLIRNPDITYVDR